MTPATRWDVIISFIECASTGIGLTALGHCHFPWNAPCKIARKRKFISPRWRLWLKNLSNPKGKSREKSRSIMTSLSSSGLTSAVPSSGATLHSVSSSIFWRGRGRVLRNLLPVQNAKRNSAPRAGTPLTQGNLVMSTNKALVIQWRMPASRNSWAPRIGSVAVSAAPLSRGI